MWNNIRKQARNMYAHVMHWLQKCCNNNSSDQWNDNNPYLIF